MKNKTEQMMEEAKRKLWADINELKAMRAERKKQEEAEAYWNQPLNTRDRD